MPGEWRHCPSRQIQPSSPTREGDHGRISFQDDSISRSCRPLCSQPHSSGHPHRTDLEALVLEFGAVGFQPGVELGTGVGRRGAVEIGGSRRGGGRCIGDLEGRACGGTKVGFVNSCATHPGAPPVAFLLQGASKPATWQCRYRSVWQTGKPCQPPGWGSPLTAPCLWLFRQCTPERGGSSGRAPPPEGWGARGCEILRGRTLDASRQGSLCGVPPLPQQILRLWRPRRPCTPVRRTWATLVWRPWPISTPPCVTSTVPSKKCRKRGVNQDLTLAVGEQCRAQDQSM